MPKFRWEGVTRTGESRKGVLEAASEEAAMNRLRAEQITTKKVKAASRELNLKLGSGVKEQDLVIFTRQLATMIDAGLPLVQCLDILATQASNPHFGKVLSSIKASVEAGSTFS